MLGCPAWPTFLEDRGHPNPPPHPGLHWPIQPQRKLNQTNETLAASGKTKAHRTQQMKPVKFPELGGLN